MMALQWENPYFGIYYSMQSLVSYIGKLFNAKVGIFSLLYHHFLFHYFLSIPNSILFF